MKFSDYFENWLNKNYYANGVKIGKDGDFYTSVSVGSFFGICIAKELVKTVQNCFDGRVSIVEIGANEGNLMCDLAQGIFTFAPNLLEKIDFYIIEPHEILRNIQSKNFENKLGDDVKITHISDIKKAKFQNAIFIANELFDAFKCEVVSENKMLFIQNDKPTWKDIDDEILNLALKFGIKNGEISKSYFDFAKEISKTCEKWIFFAFDYGEKTTQNRHTLRVYKNHEVYNFFEIENLSQYFGQSDLTYDVNFEILSNAFESVGAKQIEFKSQISALVDFGAIEILDLFLLKLGQNGYKNALGQFNRLRGEFGEKFKMIKFEKGFK